MALVEYRKTWNGFFKSRGLFVEDEEEAEKSKENLHKSIQEQTDAVKQNIKRNSKFLADESVRLRSEFQNRTGLHSLDDLRRVAREAMRLASDCLNEFMSGYRKGRDDEVEKMMTQYFQELEQEANNPEPKKKRRKRKRRIVNPYT